MRDFKYISNNIVGEDFVEMFLYSEIGFGGVDGRQFAHELNYLVNYHEPRPKEIKVRINSVGGSAMDGFSIFSAIYNANKDGKVKVNTYGDGVAASIAGVILLAGAEIFVKDYSRLMLHGVSLLNADGSEVSNISDNDKEAMLAFKGMIKTAFVNNTTVDKEYIEELLTNGRDNWFTATEAAKLGFFKEENIEKTGFEIDLPVDKGAKAIANLAQKIIVNNNKTLKQFKMKKVINLLELHDGASEEVIANAVSLALKNAQTSADALATAKNQLTEKDGVILELQSKIDVANKATALAFVENAIKDGKFTPANETEKTTLVNKAVENIESFKTMVNMMPTKGANVINQLQADGDAEKTLIEKVANRSFRKLEREDASLLKQVKNEAKGLFVKLYNAEYNTQKTEADF